MSNRKFRVGDTVLNTTTLNFPVNVPGKVIRKEDGLNIVQFDNGESLYGLRDNELQRHVPYSVSIKDNITQEKEQVNHPDHYNSHPSGIECIQVVRHMNFNLGSALKYLWRTDHKDAPIQDLEKAVWYIKDEIERLKKLSK